MSDEYPWYGVVHGDRLEQGDLLKDCPHYQVLDDGQLAKQINDVIILSQSCDLANDKLHIVQVCPFWPLEALASSVEYFRGKRGREDLRRGNLPGYHLLNRCQLPDHESDFLVCDFRSLIGVRLTTIKALASQQASRLRLLPPYREHLAQAFARFFMRVGLPVDVPSFQ